MAAGFPAGTVSGAPKVRAMEIIDELEVEKRGIYAGCVGYFSADGAMDTCIVLRTSIVKDGKMEFIEVLPGRNLGPKMEITAADLAADSQVIVSPNAMLRAGDPVKASPLPPAK